MRSRQGFSLIEVMAAIVVMSFGMLAMAQYSAYTRALIAKSSRRMEVERVLLSRAEELKAYPALAQRDTVIRMSAPNGSWILEQECMDSAQLRDTLLLHSVSGLEQQMLSHRFVEVSLVLKDSNQIELSRMWFTVMP